MPNYLPKRLPLFALLSVVNRASLKVHNSKESACNARDSGSIPGSRRSTGEENGYSLLCSWASLVAQMVKRLPTMWETQVQSLGLEDPLEKEMTTHSSTLAWKIPLIEEPGRLQSMGSPRVGHN